MVKAKSLKVLYTDVSLMICANKNGRELHLTLHNRVSFPRPFEYEELSLYFQVPYRRIKQEAGAAILFPQSYGSM